MSTPVAPRPGIGSDGTPEHQPPEVAGHHGKSAEPDPVAPPEHDAVSAGQDMEGRTDAGPPEYSPLEYGQPQYRPQQYGWTPAGPPEDGPAAAGSSVYGATPYGAASGGTPYAAQSTGSNRPRRWFRFAAGIAAFLVAAGTGAGVFVGHAAWSASDGDSSHRPKSSAASGETAAAAIASAVSAGLVDINVTLGYQQARAAGTGMVLTANGEILTNNHVIEGATSISVTDVGNGKTYHANVVGYDRTHDVAVLQLVGASGLTTVELASSSAVQTGESVVAVGNAGGAGGTPSYAAGSVIATDQSIVARSHDGGASQRLTGLIATDADVVAGDSGGPLVDSAGQVIGMNTAGLDNASRFGDGQPGTGQGYAIPINEAATIASQIDAGASSATVHVGATAFLGVGVADTTYGAEITSVLSRGAAAHAGLALGDTITSLDGQAVTGGQSLTDLLLTKRPGATVQVQYVDSNGAQHTTSVQLASGPPR